MTTSHASLKDTSFIVSSAVMFAMVNIFIRWIGDDMTPNGMALVRGASAAAVLLVMTPFMLANTTKISAKDWKLLVAAGIAQTFNWLLYIYAVQMASVAEAVVALFTYPLITALLEPVFFKKKHQPVELVASVMVLIGVFLIVPQFSLESKATVGILFGLGAGLSLAARNLIGRGIVERVGSARMNLITCSISAAAYVPLGFGELPGSQSNGVMLAALMGIFATAIPQVIFFNALKRVPATLASIIVSLQPVMAVVLAAVLLNEIPGLKTAAGGVMILASVLLVSLWKPQYRPKTLNLRDGPKTRS